jgi:pre-mRNA-processing factor SLU7
MMIHAGDALKLAETQVMCWEIQNHGEDIDVISNPSQAEIALKQIKEKKKLLEESKKKEIFEKYGGQEYQSLDPRIKLGQTEVYKEYTWDGRVVKGASKASATSKYEEDVYTNNHTSIWGSYYNRVQHCWGYACCHSLLKNSYCTGLVGTCTIMSRWFMKPHP